MNPKLVAPISLILLAILALGWLALGNSLIPESHRVFNEIGQFLRDRFEKSQTGEIH